MSAPLVSRSTGDVIPASDHNDVKSYIEDGTYRVNTSALAIGGTTRINTSAHFIPVRVIAPDTGGLLFYAADAATLLMQLDNSGNLFIKGMVSQL